MFYLGPQAANLVFDGGVAVHFEGAAIFSDGADVVFLNLQDVAQLDMDVGILGTFSLGLPVGGLRLLDLAAFL